MTLIPECRSTSMPLINTVVFVFLGTVGIENTGTGINPGGLGDRRAVSAQRARPVSALYVGWRACVLVVLNACPHVCLCGGRNARLGGGGGDPLSVSAS